MYRSMNSFKKAWVKALRSGEYKQGQEALCVKGKRHDNFCCLGVAADLLILAGHRYEWRKGAYTELGFYDPKSDIVNMAHIADVVPNWLSSWLNGSLAYHGSRQSYLIQENDAGVTFDKIADWIEKN